ncbi:hypothetical protein [Pantoea agglomerans]
MLFKFYCVDGCWNKALLQLQTLGLLNDALQKQTDLYKNLVFSVFRSSPLKTGCDAALINAIMDGEITSGERRALSETDSAGGAFTL